MPILKILLALSAAVSLSAGSARGQNAMAQTGAMTVMGNGLARDCSLAARAGATQQRYEDICTFALEREALNRRDRAATFVNRGVLKMGRRDWAGAETDFSRALKTHPELAEAFVNRGAALVGLRRYAEGRDDINRALEMGVIQQEKAYFNRALAHEGLDDIKNAYLDFLKAQELRPDWEEPGAQLVRFTVETRRR